VRTFDGRYPLLVLLGGSVALSSRGSKAAARVVINTSPEPFTNIAALAAGAC